tara:strand:- start:15 stop:239 length:225 start_codon:yes stop_codon:yes gene_type:complete
MEEFYKKYYDKDVGRKLKKMGIPMGLIYQFKEDYYIPRPAKLITLINALAEIHNLDTDQLLWECINAITGDKHE